jgi:membrane associated rhomboid family serine protease
MSYQQYSPRGFNVLPPVVKNLLIINGLVFLAQLTAVHQFNLDLSDYLGLHYWGSSKFNPAQLVTYMFLHSTRDFYHIIFNMFALWMFGNTLENVWGGKRFLTYYMVTGVGAAVVQMLVIGLRIHAVKSGLSPDAIYDVYEHGLQILSQNQNYTDVGKGTLNLLLNTSTIGASGAVFGILLAFGMMFPNSLIYLYFFFPIKAKWFVIGYGAMELYFGIRNSAGDNIAHFAHLGGMIFGFFLIKYWNKKINRFN